MINSDKSEPTRKKRGVASNGGTFATRHIPVLQATKVSAPGEDRTHDLQMALSCVIMRLTRYLLRYRGTKNTGKTPL